jgi:hypothetical protein
MTSMDRFLGKGGPKRRSPGESMKLMIDASQAVLFDPETEERVGT